MARQKTRTYLVTGAAGCVGSAIVAKLLDRGDHVVATDRPGSAFPLPAEGLDVIEGDLTDPTLPAKLVKDVDAIIHTAAVVDISWPLERLRPINVDAVERLWEAASAADVETFVHFGTSSIYAPQPRPVHEDDPFLVQNDYGVSKVLSEELLLERHGRKPCVNILRPTLIFGPRGKVLINMLAALPSLVAELTSTTPRFTGGPTFNCVHSADVAGAAIHLADNPQPHGSAYNVANDDPVDTGTMVTEALAAHGLHVVGPAVPLWFGPLRTIRPVIDREPLFAALNRALGVAWRLLRSRHRLSQEFAPVVPREMLDFLMDDLVFSNERLKSTGYELEHPHFAPAWRDTVAWFRDHRWIPT